MFTIMPMLIGAAFVIVFLVVVIMAVLAFTGKIKLQGGGGGSDFSDTSFPDD